jgi:cephalosporin hydroxylase
MDLQVRACANEFVALYERSGALDRATWLGAPVARFPFDLWIYQEIAFDTRPEVVAVSGEGADGVRFYMESVMKLLGSGRAVEGPDARALAGQIAPGERAMVIAGPGAGDLEAHAALVTDGCYLVAERAAPDGVALLAADAPFEIDRDRERLLATFNPGGYLQRTGAGGAQAGLAPEPPPEPHPDTLDRFHQLFYDLGRDTWKRNRWLGPRAFKNPLDLWIYQELLHRLQPDLIVESGTGPGGSAHFMAGVCDLIGKGRIITIDVSVAYKHRVDHPRISYIHGSSVSEQTLATVREAATGATRVLVILDSDHSRDHVLAELHAYAPLVTPGSYLVVEDTNINGHPVAPDFGPGPMEAVDEFLAEQSGFEIDQECEKFLLTSNPRGYLCRAQPARTES